MVANQVPDFLSEEEYLRLEETAIEKHEYIDGVAYAMAGARDSHVTAAGNLFAILRSHVRGSGCRVFMSDMKVRLATSRRFFYPDVVVTCDDRDLSSPLFKSFPCLIIEVLSDSTEAFDRGDKFRDYQGLETLQEYVLVSTKYPRVECFRRNEQGLWVLRSYESGAALELASLDATIPLDEIYEDVGFEPDNRTKVAV